MFILKQDVRSLCPACREPIHICDGEYEAALIFDDGSAPFYCVKCFHTIKVSPGGRMSDLNSQDAIAVSNDPRFKRVMAKVEEYCIQKGMYG